MKYWKNIVWLLLFLSLHLSDRFFPVSYWIFFAALLLASLTVISKREIRLTVNKGIIGAGLLFVSLILRFFFQGNLYGTSTFYMLLAYWLLFFIWIIWFNQGKSRIKVIAGIVVLTVAIEIVWGFGQLFGLIENTNEHFRMGGSFGNPGTYAGYLSVVSPLILSLLLTYRRNRKAENLCYLLAGCLIFIVYLLVVSQSRGAWIAGFLGCLFVVNCHYALMEKLKNGLHTTARKIVAIVCVLLVACTTGYMLYQYKSDSAFGRLLVWKVTSQKSLSIFGDGIGSFEANYGKWQSAYFASGKGTEAERYVADYVTCAYNEFLEMSIEQGIFVLVIFLSLLFFAFRQKNKTKSSLFIGAKSSLVAITVLMLVSHPMKIPAVYLYFIFCLAVVLYGNGKCTPLKWGKWTIPVLGLLIALAGGYHLYGYSLLKKGQKQVFTGQLDKGIENYRKAEPILKNNGIFHFYYGSALTTKQEYEAAVRELELSVDKTSNPNGFIMLGNNYKELGQLEKTKENYLVAINMIPSKLYPKYLLVKVLIENQEIEEAEKWAKEILATKEKTPTTAAKEIKQEMEKLLMSNYKNEMPMD